jgi:hypothetical protein
MFLSKKSLPDDKYDCPLACIVKIEDSMFELKTYSKYLTLFSNYLSFSLTNTSLSLLIYLLYTTHFYPSKPEEIVCKKLFPTTFFL